jgi:muramidase (phage lysozyme)
MPDDEMTTNVRAFLKLIRWAEHYPRGGTEEDYHRIYGGKRFADTTDHPREKVTKWKHTSDAAGAYQILASTWDDYKEKMALPDFSPTSQDKAALAIIRRKRALDLIEQGEIEQAIVRLRSQWASLPGAKQSHVTMKQALEQFNTLVRAEKEADNWDAILREGNPEMAKEKVRSWFREEVDPILQPILHQPLPK